MAFVLEAIIKKQIVSQGSIGFDEFMHLALYHQKYGYYRSKAPILGASGDFITAPEVSDMFGFALARQLKDIGDDVLEFGAGSGVLAAQILYYLDSQNALPEKYYILELSNSLKHTQQKHIQAVVPHLMERVVWLDTLPSEFHGTILANEVLDAMPTKRGMVQDKTLYELKVGLDDDTLVYQQSNEVLMEGTSDLVDGYTTEVNMQADAWIRSLADINGEFVIILIDYGYTQKQYFHPERTMGTLRCYYNHTADDNPFVDIGHKDITAWVNFSRIAQAGSNVGLEPVGFATQAMALASLGVHEFLNGAEGEERLKLLDEIKMLIMPGHMGESFKFFVLTKNKQIKLQCFEMQNLLSSL